MAKADSLKIKLQPQMKAQKDFYKKSDPNLWTGRADSESNYWHQIVQCIDLSEEQFNSNKTAEKKFALLGYCCDEGVVRNQGRPGAAKGPDAIRKMLGALPNHFPEGTTLIDAGNIYCVEHDLEGAHSALSASVTGLLYKGFFPLLLGGGHDIAYAHYTGIKKYLGASKKLGVINLDAHFDIRPEENGRNSGTPFYQIAQECKSNTEPFNYFCLGIQRQSNTKTLFRLADELGVQYLEAHDFVMSNFGGIREKLALFLEQVDHVYLTIDLDGFSSAYAPGVSAPSPFGFQPDIACEVIKLLYSSGKLISMDIAELNPDFDLDNCTARLAARLVHLASFNMSTK